MTLKKPVTSKDVARLAGVSRATVSRALNGEDSVTKKTRHKILNVADELGYRINMLGRSLNRQRTDLVGLVVRHLTDPFHAKLMAELLDSIRKTGLLPTVNEVASDREIPGLIRTFAQFRVSGVIVTSGSPPAKIAEECRKLDIPVVLINRQPNLAQLNTVCSDNGQGGALAASRLMKAGCRNIAFLGASSPTYSTLAREAAFSQTLAPHLRTATLTLSRLSATSSDYAGGFDAGKTADPASVDGIFSATDRLAMGFMDGFREQTGRRAGKDYSLIGFDDIDEARFAAYNLTTIQQDVPAIVQRVMGRLAADTDHTSLTTAADTVPVCLVERGTVRPA